MNRWPLKRIICAVMISPVVIIGIAVISPLLLIHVSLSLVRWVALTAEGEENVDFWGW